jgi:hypothetical protein
MPEKASNAQPRYGLDELRNGANRACNRQSCERTYQEGGLLRSHQYSNPKMIRVKISKRPPILFFGFGGFNINPAKFVKIAVF